MKLIDNFRISPFARIIWSTPEAQAVWEPKIEAAKVAYAKLERLTVEADARGAYTTHIKAEELDIFTRNLAEKDMVYIPLIRSGDYEGFAHSHPPVVPGKPWSYYGVVGKPENAFKFAKGDLVHNHDQMGDALGYPQCCRTFFYDVWMKGYVDPVWQAALATDEKNMSKKTEREIHLDNYHPEVISALRYIGVRLSPQIPCSATCEASKKTAEDWMSVGRFYGMQQEMEDMLEILSWPMEWSVLHGIAEIKTPLFKVSTNSMATLEKYTVRFNGTKYPEGAPAGLTFPYRKPTVNKITEHKIFKRAEQDIPLD